MRTRYQIAGICTVACALLLLTANTTRVQSSTSWHPKNGDVKNLEVKPNPKGGWTVTWKQNKKAKKYVLESGTWHQKINKETTLWKTPDILTHTSERPAAEISIGLGEKNKNPSTALACPAYTLVGVRGSGQNSEEEGYRGGLGDRAYNSFMKAKDISNAPNSLLNSIALDYPANRADTWDGMLTYPLSTHVGRLALRDSLIKWVSECPGTKYFIYGYSQGADVIATTWVGLDENVKNQVAKIYLLGDPRYNPEDTSVESDNSIKPGPLGARDALNSDKVRSWCAPEDVVCQKTAENLLNLKQRVHGTYYDQVQETIAHDIAATILAHQTHSFTQPE